jgi:hypothetical protein
MKLYRELAEYYYEIEKVGRKFDEEIDFLVAEKMIAQDRID